MEEEYVPDNVPANIIDPYIFDPIFTTEEDLNEFGQLQSKTDDVIDPVTDSVQEEEIMCTFANCDIRFDSGHSDLKLILSSPYSML